MGIFDWLLNHGDDEPELELEDTGCAAGQPRIQTARAISDIEAEVVIVPPGQDRPNAPNAHLSRTQTD